MTEEVKKENETKTPEENAGQETFSKKQKDIDKILKDLPLERKEKENLQRFGYFSIPYPSTVGDQAYSRNPEYHHKVVDRQVITENRGIYVQGPKSGKGPDVYFPPPESTKKLKIQKEKLEIAKRKERNPFPFKPTGPQIAFSFYKKLDDDKPLPERTLPLTIEPDKKKYKIDHFKVQTKPRNIQASPNRPGVYPNDYFEFYRADDELQEN